MNRKQELLKAISEIEYELVARGIYKDIKDIKTVNLCKEPYQEPLRISYLWLIALSILTIFLLLR